MIGTLVRRLWVGVLGLAAAGMVQAQTLETFAGGRVVDNMPALDASVSPNGILIDGNGAIFLLDGWSGRVMRRDPSSTMLTGLPVGVPQYPYERVTQLFRGKNGVAYALSVGAVHQLDLTTGNFWWGAQIDQSSPLSCSQPESNGAQFTADVAGVIYWADPTHNSVCRLTTNGVVERVAGATGLGFTGDGGPASAAKVNSPRGIAIDGSGNIYFSDSNNNRIRRIAAGTGIITTFAGDGTANWSGENVPKLTSGLPTPEPLAFDAAGNLYIGETGGFRLRRVDASTGLVTTVLGNGQLNNNSPDGGLATQTPINWLSRFTVATNGDILFADNGRLRKVTKSTGIVSTIAGNGYRYSCGDSLPPLQACIDEPRGVAVAPNGDVYISDTFSRRVRKVSAATGVITTVAGRNGPYGQNLGEGGPAINASFANAISDVALDAAGNLFIAGGSGNRLHRVDRITGNISTIAGSGVYGFSGDGGPATAARTANIVAVAIDSAGNVFFSDRSNGRVRRVDAATGTITTYAGGGTQMSEGIPATSANFFTPLGLAFDPSGNLLIADSGRFRVMKVDRVTGILTFVAGNGTSGTQTGFGGPATAASINSPLTVTTDPRGNVFIYASSAILRVDATSGIITRQTPPSLRTPDGRFSLYADDMQFDGTGRLYLGGYQAVLRLIGLPYSASDVTPPTVTPAVTGTVGSGGWYRSDVQVTWSLTDPESTVSGSAGCSASSVTSDTSGVTFTCTGTSEGGTTTQSVTVRRDTTAPEISFGAPAPSPDASGWNSTDVAMPFTASDALSGVFSTSTGSPLIITGEGTGLTGQVVVTDGAGNSATLVSPPVRIDRSAPLVTPNISGQYWAQGWYNSDVQISWSIVDDNSPILTTTGCEAGSVTEDTTGVTFTCTATSTGGSTTKSVTIKKDVLPPVIEFGAPNPAADESGWYGGDVSLPYTVTDATSGVSPGTEPGPLLLTGTGQGVAGYVQVFDNAGNSANIRSPSVNIDRTPPVVYASFTGTQGAYGWYRSDVTVNWNVVEVHGGVTREGCDPVSVTTDTSGTNFTCTVTSAGGTTSRSITVKRDATPPTLEFGAPSPASGASGWYAGDVSFPFTTADATSGVVSTSANPVVISGSGSGLSADVIVSDLAGNTATFPTPAVNIDGTPPAVQPIVTGTLGANGWYTSNVQVSWVIDESPTNILSVNGCGNGSVTADTTGVTFACSVVSGGGTAAASVTIKRDATAPTVSFATGTPAPNAAGWVKGNVSVAFTANDAFSGLATTSAASPLVLSTEGSGVTGQVIATDQAGNSATFTTPAYNIDKTLPVVTLTAPANGVFYGFYQDLPAQFTCTDVSLQSCTGTVAQGEMVNTRTAGNRTFTVTAKDRVNNTTTASSRYTVISYFNFEGFLAPMNAAPALNIITRGAMVPLRWRLPDGNGGFVSSTASFTSATVSTINCSGGPSVPFNDVATGDAGISFDPATNAFTYNWQTSASWTGCRKVVIKLKDNGTWEARFRLQ